VNAGNGKIVFGKGTRLTVDSSTGMCSATYSKLDAIILNLKKSVNSDIFIKPIKVLDSY